MSRRSRYSAPALVGRQLLSERGTLLLVALTVLLVSAVLTAWPRAVDGLLGADLTEQVDALSAAQRDPNQSVRWLAGESPDGEISGEAVLEATAAALSATREQAGPILREVLGTAELTFTRSPRDPVEKGPRADDVFAMALEVRLDPLLSERVEVVEGAEPEPYDLTGLFDSDEDFGRVVAEKPPMEVVVSVETAERMRWEVGEVRSLAGVIPFPLRLVGTFEARDPDAGYWSHLESTLFPFIVEDGNVGTTVNGVAYAHPSALPALAVPGGLVVDAWFPVDPQAVAVADREALVQETRGFLSRSGMTSELDSTLEDTTRRHATFTSLLDVLAVGPVGAAVGVLWLAGVLAVERRRSALGLVRARGASAAESRLVMAAQGAVVGLPAAALGGAVATWLVPGPSTVTGFLLPAAVGLAPALLMALAAGSVGGGREGRHDLGTVRLRRLRPLLEVLVVALATLSVLMVRQRGLGGGLGADPLLLASPVLLTAAACVLVLRLYPVPMRALTRGLHGGRRLPHFLGAAQATRSPGAGLVAVVALVLGVAVAVFSGLAFSTVRTGLDRTASSATGSDLRLDAPAFTDDDVATVAGVPGVAEVAAVGRGGQLELTVGRSSERVHVLTVDAAAAEMVQEDLDVERWTAGLADGTGALPVVLAPREARPDADATLDPGGDRDPVDVEVLDTRVAVPGVASGTAWLVVDRATYRELTGRADTVERLLLRLDPGAGPEAVLDAARTALGDDVRLTGTTPAQVRERVADGALVQGMTVGLAVVTVLSGLLCVVVVVLALAVGGPARGRLAALLATVGAPRGTAWRLVAWEVVPLVTVALLTGGLVGALLPWVALATADLRPFTGGAEQPPVTADPTVFAALAAAGALTVALASALAAIRARRTRAALVLREGERA